MISMESAALEFCKNAHNAAGQRRKYTNDPYWVHPVSVAEIVKSVRHTSNMVAAALLHDTVEDTDATIDDIQEEFGYDIADLVYWLTDVSKPEDGNRAQRKAIDRAHTAKAPPEAKTIKLADLIDNTSSIAQYDPDFWQVYRQEKLLLLEVLREGDQELWDRAMEQCS